MSGSLPSTLTVLRPIGFGSMRGPDGSIATTIPNYAAEDEEEATNHERTAHTQSPTTPQHAEFERRKQQQLDAAAAKVRSSPTARHHAISPPTHGPKDVDAIELEDTSHDGRDTADFSGIELGEMEPQRKDMTASTENDGSVLSPSFHPSRQMHDNLHLDAIHGDDEQKEISPASHTIDLSSPDSLPPSQAHRRHSQSGLLSDDGSSQDAHPVALPSMQSMPETTMPPMSKSRTETFAEVKTAARWKRRGMQTMSIAAACMGVACIGVGVSTLPTSSFYPGLSIGTILLASIQLLLSPLSFLAARRFKSLELQWSSVGAALLGAGMLVLGLLTATKQRADIQTAVNREWYLDENEELRAKWNYDPVNLINACMDDLTSLTIVQFFSLACLALVVLFSLRVRHMIQRHLSIVELHTTAKSETQRLAAKRREEVAAYRAALERDPTLAQELDRIPDEVKRAKAKERKKDPSKKYAMNPASAASPSKRKKSKKKHHDARSPASNHDAASERNSTDRKRRKEKKGATERAAAAGEFISPAHMSEGTNGEAPDSDEEQDAHDHAIDMHMQ